jgi:hypothetical protein
MATCPRCKGPLTEGHRCPRRQSLVVLEIISWAIGGALAGWLLLFVFDPQTQLSDDPVTLILGAAAGIGINRLIRS